MTRFSALTSAAARRKSPSFHLSRSLGLSCRTLSLSPLAEAEFLCAQSQHLTHTSSSTSEQRQTAPQCLQVTADPGLTSEGTLTPSVWFQLDAAWAPPRHCSQNHWPGGSGAYEETQILPQNLLPPCARNKHTPSRNFHRVSSQSLIPPGPPGFRVLDTNGELRSSIQQGTLQGPLVWRAFASAPLHNHPLFPHTNAQQLHFRPFSSSPTPDKQRPASATPATSAPGAPGGAGAASGGGGSQQVSTAAVQEELAEECDEAVEDLGEVKARVRAAREAMRKGEGVLKASFLVVSAVVRNLAQGIWSLRVVLTWTRKDWLDTTAGWWKAIKHAAHHYWVGTKLLWADIRISSRLMLKTANGQSLTRRERQQLMRTSADIFRLVPFAVFVIVPFMEFLLPVALRLFPNMLPSTYQDAKQEEAKLKRILQARLQMAKFLQDTVHEMAKEVKGRRSGEIKKTAEELQRFMTKVRTGGRVSNEEIMGFASLFNDELTLDNMTRPRLVSMCKYMGLQTFGTDSYLRYILRARLAWIKEDDKMIQAEGVDSLSEAELRSACRERGMLGLRDVPSMRQQLQDWLDLSLNRSVPSSLLILSRSFLLAGKVRPEEAVQATLSSLPEQVVKSVGASVPAGDELSERQRKLDKLREEEKLIKEEAEEEARRKASDLERVEVKAEIDRALEEMRVDTGVVPHSHSVGGVTGSVGVEEVGLSEEERRRKAQELLARASKEELCDLSAALAVLASSSAVSKERVDFLRLVNREIELYNQMVEKSGQEGEESAKLAYQAAREASEREKTAIDAASKEDEEISEALINKVDTMLHQLEKELDRVDAKIGSKHRVLDTDYDGKVSPEEVATAAAMLRDSLGQGQVPELIANLTKDKDGKILVEDIVRLGTMDTTDNGKGVKQAQSS